LLQLMRLALSEVTVVAVTVQCLLLCAGRDGLRVAESRLLEAGRSGANPWEVWGWFGDWATRLSQGLSVNTYELQVFWDL